YLRYFFQEKRYWKKAFGLGLLLSFFYEITQLTGVYGIYNCPYRIFDVDDLFLNSTGALFGFLVAPILLALFPSQKSLLAKAEKIQHSGFVPPLSQLIAIYIDYLFIKFSWSLIARFFSTNEFFEFFYFTIGFVILYFFFYVFVLMADYGTMFITYILLFNSVVFAMCIGILFFLFSSCFSLSFRCFFRSCRILSIILRKSIIAFIANALPVLGDTLGAV